MSRIDDLRFLVDFLQEERAGSATAGVGGTVDEAELFRMFRSLVNTREPLPAPPEFLEAQDRMLQSLIGEAGVTDAASLPRTPLDGRVSLWRGDITTLAADAVVNAANSRMLGCWVPGHYCIDNAVHTFAGVQLRAECARLMSEQGYPEPTGMAKLTPAYNLPSKWVIHTVGPIVQGRPSDLDCALLANCYGSCLAAAENVGAESIAFCCISTGVFGFPQRDAAAIAVAAVRDWLDENGSGMHVVFNVFGERDEGIYHGLLFR